jgi:hypothetical protein
VRGFFDVGTRPKSDVVRAEVDVANARVDAIRADNAERVARVALNTAIGVAATTKFDLLDSSSASVTDARWWRRLKRRPEYAGKLDRERGEPASPRFFPDVVGGGRRRARLQHVMDGGHQPQLVD